jgi:hypothetical protein
MQMNSKTKAAVKEILKSFALAILKDKYNADEIKRAFPFHTMFFDDVGIIAFKRERSIVTKAGTKLYPTLAKTIAADRYNDVATNKRIIAKTSKDRVNMIGTIVDGLRNKSKKPDHTQEMKSILSLSDGDDEEIRVIADLYIGDHEGGPLFSELKSPKPNIDICAETKSKLLRFKTGLDGKNPQAFLAFPYNPYVTRKDYKWWATPTVMDMDREVLMGDEFWDLIGGPGTFDEMLQIIEVVKQELDSEVS